MYRNHNSFDPFAAIVYLSIVLIFVVTLNAATLQKAINDTCGSKYTLIQVAISGDKLQQLCKIKEQQITIRNQVVK